MSLESNAEPDRTGCLGSNIPKSYVMTVDAHPRIWENLGLEVLKPNSSGLLMGPCTHEISVESVNCNRAGHTIVPT